MAPEVVKFEDVSVAYGGIAALNGVSLTVREGEKVALVGPSGAGKTTALGLVTGWVAQAAGKVSVFGRDLRELPPGGLRKLRANIGSIRQSLDLVGPLRVVHNVNAGKLGKWSTRKALWSLVRPDATEAARVLALMGVEDKVNRRTDTLSGGERQRVALARVLLQDPPLVLADEPVSNLDPGRAGEVMDLLEGVVARGRTMIVSLHDLDLARRRFSRVVGLRSGRVMFDLPAGAVTDAEAGELYRIASG